MKNPFIAVPCLCLTASLVACGGGGSDSASLASGGKVSQAEIKNVATLGVTSIELIATRVALGLGYQAGVLAAISTTDTAGPQVLALDCVSGSASVNVTKPAAHAGLVAGDQVVLTYSKCVDSQGSSSDGVVKLNLKKPVRTTGNDFSVGFDADFTALVLSNAGVTTQYDGAVNITADTSGDLNVVNSGFTVLPGKPLKVVNTAGGVALTSTISAGATFAETESAVPNSVSYKFDGVVASVIPGRDIATVTVATPVALQGTSTAAGGIAATSGVINSSAVATDGRAIATSTTVSGTTVTVNGDSDFNGSLDLSFKTTWAALETP